MASSGAEERSRDKLARKESDSTGSRAPKKVSSVERVGSHAGHGISFPVCEHPDKSVVHGPGGKGS